MTPAEELAAAADKLDALARKATPDLGSFDDIEDVLFPEDLAYIAAMNPLVGKALAAWLRHEAEGAVHGLGVLMPTLAIARLINGSES